MDIVGKEALEEMLRDYEGTLIFVSHDRYLIRQVADSLLIFGTDGVQYFPYDYEEYERTYGREKLQEAAEVWKIGEARGTACGVIGAAGGGAAAVEGKAAAATGGHTDADGAAVSERKKGANPGKERAKAERRVARLEELMEECDSKKAALNERLSDPAIASDYAELSKIQQEIDEINSRYEEYFEEWGTLSELLEE
jgi:ATP-binding cassette subfamily F protein 3